MTPSNIARPKRKRLKFGKKNKPAMQDQTRSNPCQSRQRQQLNQIAQKEANRQEKPTQKWPSNMKYKYFSFTAEEFALIKKARLQKNVKTFTQFAKVTIFGFNPIVKKKNKIIAIRILKTNLSIIQQAMTNTKINNFSQFCRVLLS